MRMKGSAAVLEDRRRRALALVRQGGLSLNEVARRIGCAASSVMRWERAWRRRGAASLKVRASPGRPPKLAARKRRRLVARLLAGARAAGYPTELWTTARIAEIIHTEFGVRYHRDHVGRLLHGLGWSHQKPARRARERDERAIAQWTRTQWPRVKKTPRAGAPTSRFSMNRAS